MQVNLVFLMDKEKLQALLVKVQAGAYSVDEAMSALRHWPAEQLACAHLDHHRSLRTAFPEVVYGENKSAEQIADILARLLEHASPAMATRVDPVKAAVVLERLAGFTYHEHARMLVAKVRAPSYADPSEVIVVLSAGTSDMPVAEEAAVTARSMGNRVETVYDVGVAGLHRLLSQKTLLDTASVLVVVAGMEGALPSVVGGLVDRPIIAVPTSVGYGTGFGGFAALLGMLNSCAPGVAVVNIDNGFGAGCIASAINHGQMAARITGEAVE